MKTYEIKMNRSRWTSLVIAVLSIAIIVMMLCPYFTFGDAATKLVPENDGDANILYGATWVLSGTDAKADGYKEVVISKDGKDSTLKSVNILRVNQINAQEVYTAAIANYNSIAESVEACDVYVQQAQAKYDELLTMCNAVAEKYGMAKLDAVTETAAVDTAAAEGEAAATEAATEEVAEVVELTPEQQDYETLQKAYKKAATELGKAKGFYDTAVAKLAVAKTALDDAHEAVKKAYSEDIDASFAWVNETTEAYNAALKEAYPDYYVRGYVEATIKDFKKFLLETVSEEELNAAKEKNSKKPEEVIYQNNVAGKSFEENLEVYTAWMDKNGELDESKESEAIAATLGFIAEDMSDETRDQMIYGRLADMKAASNAAAAEASVAAAASASAIKEGEKKQTADKAAKNVTQIEKQLASVQEIYDKAFPAVETEEGTEEAAEETAVEFVATAIERAEMDSEIEALENAATEAEYIETKCKVVYKKGATDTIGKVTFTFANGDVKVTTFAADVTYDGIQHASILSFVAFPEDLKDTLEGEVAYQIYEYSRNTAVLVPIMALICLILSVVFAIMKKDTFGSGVAPCLAGLIGVIGYLTSKFLKLGDYYVLHIVFFAVLLVVAAFQLYFGIKEMKEEKKRVEEIEI